jgi:aryl-alcohol dehydrogenase-like predicted oxidoreductase
LGTAQLGQPYGVANTTGQPDREVARALVRAAAELGVGAIDTAPAYGNAEAIVGEAGVSIPVFSKVGPGSDPRRSVLASLAALRRQSLDILFLHDPTAALYAPVSAEVSDVVGDCVKAVGVSVYTRAEFEACLRDPGVTAIQAPVSLADRRLVSSGLLEQAAAQGVSVYARSVYLQGALLLDPGVLPPHLVPLGDLGAALRAAAAIEGIHPAELCVAYVRDLPAVAGVVLGSETIAQLRQNVSLMSGPPLPTAIRLELEGMSVPESVVDPRLWPSHG